MTVQGLDRGVHLGGGHAGAPASRPPVESRERAATGHRVGRQTVPPAPPRAEPPSNRPAASRVPPPFGLAPDPDRSGGRTCKWRLPPVHSNATTYGTPTSAVRMLRQRARVSPRLVHRSRATTCPRTRALRVKTQSALVDVATSDASSPQSTYAVSRRVAIALTQVSHTVPLSPLPGVCSLQWLIKLRRAAGACGRRLAKRGRKFKCSASKAVACHRK